MTAKKRLCYYDSMTDTLYIRKGDTVNQYFICYPGFRRKALTLSYDDGVVQDIRLMEIMDRHGIKGTFNLNSGSFDGHDFRSANTRMTREEAVALYKNSGHEVAVHSRCHPFLEQLPQGVAAWEIVKDRELLENIFGGIIRGMAYPMGTFSDDVVTTLRQCGIAYARTVKVHRTFELPKDWLRLESTCRNKDPELMSICDRFLNLKPTWGPKLFYMWGHSYEFDEPGGWETIEAFCKKMGGHADIWYATNIEIYDYLEAAGRIQSSVNGSRLYNPTNTTLYLRVGKDKHCIFAPGETLELQTL